MNTVRSRLSWRPISPGVGLVIALALGTTFRAHAGPIEQGASAPPATLAEAERELAELDRRAGELEGKTSRLTADIATRERRAVVRSRAFARLARAGLLPVAGGFEAFVAHAMRVEGARRGIVGDLGALSQLRREQREAAALRERVVARRAVVVAQRDTLAQAQALLAEAEERRRAFERAFSTSNAPGGHVAVYGAGVTVTDAQPSGFEALRGRLPLPVSGRAEVKSARRRSAAGPGVELHTQPGTAVRAVAAGRVAFSSQYGDYGRIVIVDHGDRYFSVSANLGSVDVRVGDEVTAGGRLGTVGDEGGQSSLYFELRHGNETLDPRPWLGL